MDDENNQPMEPKPNSTSRYSQLRDKVTLAVMLSITVIASVFISSFLFETTATRYVTSVIKSIKGDADVTKDLLKRYSTLVDELKFRYESQNKNTKEKFLNISNISFHYVDTNQLKNFYNDYFKEPTIEQFVSEVANEVSGDIKGQLPKVIEAQAGGKSLNKWISTMKIPDVSVNEMFRRYQRSTIENNQVLLGLENLEVDLTELNKFNDLTSELSKKFQFEIDEHKANNYRLTMKRKAAEKTLERLEKATDWVLVEGNFTISDISNDFFKVTHLHAVNEYISDDKKRVTLSAMLRKNSIESSISGNYSQSIGQTIPLRIYGKIWQPISRASDIWELQITPLAVY